LEIRRSTGEVIYSEIWSTRSDDMEILYAFGGAESPEEYFARFGSLAEFDVRSPKDLEIERDVVAWSLDAQGLDGVTVEEATRYISEEDSVRTLTYGASWREDLRVVVFVPRLGRAVAVKVGYD
jgi:hypothetical protein